MTDRQIKDCLFEAIKNVRSLGYSVGCITDITISSRYKRAWGKCYRNGNTFRIGLGTNLLRTTDTAVRDTIHHEVIHTVPGCFNHGFKWKMVAAQCDAKFGTRIKRVTSEEEKMTRR
jgi:hypothetical protein